MSWIWEHRFAVDYCQYAFQIQKKTMIWATFDLRKFSFVPELCHVDCKAKGSEPGSKRRRHLSIDTMRTTDRETMPYLLCFRLSLAVMSYLNL